MVMWRFKVPSEIPRPSIPNCGIRMVSRTVAMKLAATRLISDALSPRGNLDGGGFGRRHSNFLFLEQHERRISSENSQKCLSQLRFKIPWMRLCRSLSHRRHADVGRPRTLLEFT